MELFQRTDLETSTCAVISVDRLEKTGETIGCLAKLIKCICTFLAISIYSVPIEGRTANCLLS